jgi:chromate transporter
MTELVRLASIMAFLSVFSFGGANAILPQMHADVVDHQHWLSSEQFARFWALGGLVPGPTLTVGPLIGYAVAGLAGAAVATIALFAPAGLIVYALGNAWDRLRENPWRTRIAAAIAPVVLGLVWAGCVPLARGAIDGLPTILIAVIVGALLLATKINRAAIVFGAGVVGYLWLR